jgi:hypothetical protein
MTDRTGTALPRWRSATTTDPLAARTNGHTAQGKRIRDLYRALTQRIGDPTDVLAQADVLRAAELRVAAEELRAKVLHGEPCEPDALVRLENLANRAERRLSKLAPPKSRTLADHIAVRRSAVSCRSVGMGDGSPTPLHSTTPQDKCD